MEIKEKVDLLSKRADIINKKLLTLLIIDGAIWLYGVNGEKALFWAGLLAFIIVSFAVVSNIFKLGEIENKLKELENE